jgi:hypothetical protein
MDSPIFDSFRNRAHSSSSSFCRWAFPLSDGRIDIAHDSIDCRVWWADFIEGRFQWLPNCSSMSLQYPSSRAHKSGNLRHCCFERESTSIDIWNPQFSGTFISLQNYIFIIELVRSSNHQPTNMNIHIVYSFHAHRRSNSSKRTQMIDSTNSTLKNNDYGKTKLNATKIQ